jgi:glycosyltransferase involved in cell wall biosynthesis
MVKRQKGAGIIMDCENKFSIRIALFLPSLNGGGAERVMINLAKGFLSLDYHVDMILAKAEGSYLDQVPSGVNIIGLNSSKVLFSLPGLVRYLRKYRPAVIYSAISHANIIALWAKSLASVKTKVVACEHSTLSRSIQNPVNFRDKLLPYFMRRFYPQACVVAVSQGVADDLSRVLKLPRDRIYAIANPIVEPKILDLSKEPVVDPWFMFGDQPVILSVGRLTEAKDFGTLIKAFAEVLKVKDCRLVILGEGEKRRELESLIESLNLVNKISMPGFVDNPYKYMRQASVFVLSSKWEGLPNVLIEAMACGTPLVATDCPSGPNEILQNGEYGLLVSVGDKDKMAEAILQQLEVPTDCNKLLERSLNFSVTRAVNEYLKLI